LRAVGSHLANRHLLHAASLAWNGGGIILPGASGRGKTTLTLALVKHGFRFLSDDVACLDLVNKQVEPFPRSINLCRSGMAMLTALVGSAKVGAALAEGRWDIDDLFPGSAGEARPLRWVVLLQGFGPRPRLVPISKRQALWQALRLSHTPIRQPAHALWSLSPLIDQANCYELTAGDPESTADLLRRLAESDTDDQAN
ncbi:MAG: hypothetical protein GY856_43695, partial [bacterium]|nr:hypothetical protein [bacterium]